MKPMAKKYYTIAMVTDYFYPSTGGIETHVKMLGEELCHRGHSVIVITHKYPGHSGNMKIGPLIVYYLDVPVVARNTAFPSIFGSFLIYAAIFEKHSVDIVHGHQSMSTMCMEAIYHANHLGIKTVLTDHSVFEFGKFERVVCDALALFICKNLDRAICVSNIARINTAARIGIPLEDIKVIPNGIQPSRFYPKGRSTRKKIRVLFCARLVFRKGIDLLAAALPLICKEPLVEITIIGDGPKKDDLMQVIDEAELHGQVKVIGEMDYRKVPDVMRVSDIFLNTSLTETFCTSILEAASCGLLVVSTNVGGIHEVLEDGEIYFCKPTAEDIAEQVLNAARELKTHIPGHNYQRIIAKYDWKIIAEETERVYNGIVAKKHTAEEMVREFVGIRNFLCRFGTWIEFIMIRFVNWLNM